MHRLGLALALTFVLAPASAWAGRAKPAKPHAARKADTTKKRSTRAAPSSSAARKGECTRVILGEVSIRELRLVGIVGRGRAQKALLMDISDEPITIMPGQCVGIERVPYEDVVKPLTSR